MMALWVLGTSGVGFYFGRYVKSTQDFLLAGKRLRWWQIALAQTADAVDANDFVAVTGQGYRAGFTQIGYAWWGMGIGSLLLSRYIAPLLYRTGVYTNAEYLELRFNASLRITSAIVQVLYRFVAMALVVYAMAVMFKVIIQVDLWHGIWGAMILTLAYVFTSGQLGVVMAAIPQVLLMLFTSIFIFVAAYREIGGWTGFWAHQETFGDMIRLAGYSEPGVPAGVYLWGLILTLVTYPIVNQTVAQRIFAARSEADARKGTVASLVPWYLITGVSIVVGVMGVVLLPELQTGQADHIFPLYMQRYLPPGLLGLGMAALVVASMSTGAGIGTAIAGLLTMDVCKRFEKQPHPDVYYLRLTRIFAVLSIVCGTGFAMFIPRFGGMIPFYVALTGTFFLPLTIPYLGGAWYKRASRGSGLAAVLGGAIVGAILFLGEKHLPVCMAQAQWRPFWVLAAGWLLFFVWSLVENRIRGPIPANELASILNRADLGRLAQRDKLKQYIETQSVQDWPQHKTVNPDSLGIPNDMPWYARSGFFEGTAVILLIVLMIWWW